MYGRDRSTQAWCRERHTERGMIYTLKYSYRAENLFSLVGAATVCGRIGDRLYTLVGHDSWFLSICFQIYIALFKRCNRGWLAGWL